MTTKFTKPKNIVELREFTLDVLTDLRNNQIPADKAKECSNAVGKAINTIKVQLEHAALRKEKPAISFLLEGEK